LDSIYLFFNFFFKLNFSQLNLTQICGDADYFTNWNIFWNFYK